MTRQLDDTGNRSVVVLFVLTVLAWIGLEAYFIANGRPTISARVRALYFADPDTGVLTGLVVGLLFAHFFFSQRGRD